MSLQANELRIGNTVVLNGIIVTLGSELFCLVVTNQTAPPQPIPFTPEILEKFGFESNPYQDRYENKVIHVECNKLRGETELWIDRMPHIKFVHQLQNLHYALTGEELEYKQ